MYAGDKSFFGENVQFRAAEYVSNNAVTVPEIYFLDGITWQTALATATWGTTGFMNTDVIVRNGDASAEFKAPPGASPSADGTWDTSAKLKNPFVLEVHAGEGRLLRYTNSASNWATMEHFITTNPRWAVPLDKQTALFHTVKQIQLGDTICRLLAMVIPGPAQQ